MNLLLAHEADLEARDRSGATALIAASGDTISRWIDGEPFECSRQEHPLVVKLLLETGANVEAKDNDGVTALQAACRRLPGPHKRFAEVRQRFTSDTEIEQNRVWRHTEEVHLFELQSLAIIESLLTHGANIEARDGKGRTPLLHACGSSEPQYLLVQELLKQGADIEARDVENRHTPLLEMCSVWKADLEIRKIRTLLDWSPDSWKEAKDVAGRTAPQILESRGQKKQAEWLRDYYETPVDPRKRKFWVLERWMGRGYGGVALYAGGYSSWDKVPRDGPISTRRSLST